MTRLDGEGPRASRRNPKSLIDEAFYPMGLASWSLRSEKQESAKLQQFKIK